MYIPPTVVQTKDISTRDTYQLDRRTKHLCAVHVAAQCLFTHIYIYTSKYPEVTSWGAIIYSTVRRVELPSRKVKHTYMRNGKERERDPEGYAYVYLFLSGISSYTYMYDDDDGIDPYLLTYL